MSYFGFLKLSVNLQDKIGHMSQARFSNTIDTMDDFTSSIGGSQTDVSESDGQASTSKYFRQQQASKSKTFEKASSFYTVHFPSTLKADLTREEVFDRLKIHCRSLIVSKEINQNANSLDESNNSFFCLLFLREPVCVKSLPVILICSFDF